MNHITVKTLMFSIATLVAHADPLDTWTVRNQLPQANPKLVGGDLYGVAYGNGQFVAVGGPYCCGGVSAGVVLTSQDGVNWVQRDPQVKPRLFAIAYGGDLFVAVGDVGAIVTSPDGVAWTSRASPVQDQLHAIVYGNGQFVAVGGTGTTVFMLSSTDGEHWVLQRSSDSSYERSLYGIVYGQGQFVAVGAWFNDDTGQYESLISTSPNGRTWLDRQSDTTNQLSSVAYAEGRFVAVGGRQYPESATSARIMMSMDGTNWVHVPTGTQNPLAGITYGQGRFVAVSPNGTGLVSPDGMEWVEYQARNSLLAVAYGQNLFVAVGSERGDCLDCHVGTILTSTDGGNWSTRLWDPTYRLSSIAHGNGQFVAAGGGLLTSPDGVDWVQRLSGNISSIAYGGSVFVAVGAFNGNPPSGAIVRSTNGLNWAWQRSGTQVGLRGIAYGKNQFVAIGSGYAPDGLTLQSVLLGSDNGVNWTRRSSDLTNWLSSIAYGQGKFVAVGSRPINSAQDLEGTLLISADGTNWSEHLFEAGNWFTWSANIAFANDRFIVSDGIANLWMSSDGMVWTHQSNTNGVSSGGSAAGQIVAVGGSSSAATIDDPSIDLRSTILTSNDGVQWIPRATPTTDALRAVVHGNGHVVAVGDYGTILQSGTLISLMLQPKLGSHGLLLSLDGPAGAGYSIQTSVDLLSWRNLTNITTLPGNSIELDAPPNESGYLFYRASSQ